jgi:hypothetical protein
VSPFIIIGGTVDKPNEEMTIAGENEEMAIAGENEVLLEASGGI